MKKKFLVLMLSFLVFAVSISAFAETTIRVAWWGSQDRHNRTLEVIKMFEEQYPDINVEPEYTGFNGYWEKIAAEAAGRNLPDVWQHGYGLITRYIQQGMLRDLSPYVESGELGEEYIDITLKYGDKMYGATLGYNAYGLVYDPAMFEEAGVEAPKDGDTWEDYIRKSEAVHEALGVYARNSYMLSEGTDGFCAYLAQNGTDLYYGPAFDTKEAMTMEVKELGYDDDQLFIDYHTMALEKINEGVFAPMDLTSELNNNVERDPLVTGKAAMSSAWSNQLVAMETAAGRPLSLTIPPQLKDGEYSGTFVQPSQYFVVTSYIDKERADAAVKFINFFVDNLEANKVLMAERGVPASEKIRDGLAPYLEKSTKKTFEYIGLARQYAGPIPPPYPSAQYEVMEFYKKIRAMIYFGIITPEEGAVEFRKRANQIIKTHLE